MSYEEKYKEALERARAINDGKDVDVETGTTICEYIFPELKVSEDKKMLNACINILRNVGHSHLAAWLEKQGEQAQFDYERAYIPQKDFAPIEPKFKVGDRLTRQGYEDCVVKSIYDNVTYVCENEEGETHISMDEQDLWTLKNE